MKIGIFDPYLDSLAGGERYILTVAERLSQDHQVEVFWDNTDLKKEVKDRLVLNLDKVKFVNNVFTRDKNILERVFKSSNYDLIFYLSDGSIPTSAAKRNLLHFQVPFCHLDGKTLANRLKLSRFNWIVCNSHFTKKFIDKTYGVKSLVLYPPVDIGNLAPQEKKNLILTVGRFTNSSESKQSFSSNKLTDARFSSNKQSFSSNKKQEVMIDVFKRLIRGGLIGWKFYLVGGLLNSDRKYFQKLEKQIAGYPIELLANIPFGKLKQHYGEAKIYWHAKGYGEDEEKNPEAFEHFGISCVEAMAAGAVPIVFNGGGLREIVTPESGLLWRTKNELQDLTRQLIGDEGKLAKLRNGALNRAKEFSKEVFLRKFDEIILS